MSVIAAATFSLGAPLSRLALPASAAEVTFGRLLVAAAAVALTALAMRQSLRSLLRPEAAALGAVLYLHFYLFTFAAQTTTAAHALSIVYTSPILVLLASRLFLREPSRRTQMLGVLAALTGIGVLTGFEPEWTRERVLGDLAALGSAVALSAYVVSGRALRRRGSLLTYVTGVYAWSTVFSLPGAMVAFDAAHLNGVSIAATLALGLAPMAIGHTLLNAAIRRVHAAIPNALTAQEVTGGVILSALMFGETPGPNALIGGLVALAGVAAVIIGAPRAPREAPDRA